MSFLQSVLKSLRSNIDILEAEFSRQSLPSPEPFLPAVEDKDEVLPSWAAFDAVEKIRLDVRALDAAVTPSHIKLLELGLFPIKTSCLNIAVELNISSIIDEAGGKAKLVDIADKLDVNEHKLGRVLRSLTEEFVYQEVSPGIFSNTRHGKLLTNGNASRFLSLLTQEGLQSATGLRRDLTSENTKNSFAPDSAPFCSTVAKNGETFFEYMSQAAHADILEKVTLGVVPWLNRLTRPALLQDFPWSERGDAHVIDVGCGPGDSGVDILRQNPGLRWTFQDLPPVIEQLKVSLPSDLSPKLTHGSIQCIVQDYFKENVSEGDIWYLRGVIREYDDPEAVAVLSNIAAAMRKTPGSRMVINEILNASPFINLAADDKNDKRATAQLAPSIMVPDKQSRLTGLANLMTWNTFLFFGGKERSFTEVEQILHQAGLKATRFFPFRSITCMIECEVK
ncbi:S-adenosyl-L-methionine-dependent methyltransferase [Pyrenochaeta sp. MPI-SDFR-AT-0127]|nr:S-adenosyl-L-methionine-dependent methyltransferase [Pyrenochaeta sp. MPI-SDFR-AT-0127]